MEDKGAINIYVCEECGKAVSTINLATGVTPVYTSCIACDDGMMVSMQYNLRDTLHKAKCKSLRVTHAWYRPTPGRVMDDEIEHVLKGGLLMDMLDSAVWASFTSEPECSCDSHWAEFLQKAYASTQN